MDFSVIRSDIKASVHQQNVCKDGYAALLRADDCYQLTDVIRQYWADLNHDLWPVFQRLLKEHYADCRDAFSDRGITYNEDASRGLCVVDEYADSVIRLSGIVKAVVHGNASVLVSDSAVVSLLDEAKATSMNMSRVSAWQRASVHATGSSTVRASDESSVVADGAVTVHLSDNASVRNLRSYRIFDSRNSSLLIPN